MILFDLLVRSSKYNLASRKIKEWLISVFFYFLQWVKTLGVKFHFLKKVPKRVLLLKHLRVTRRGRSQKNHQSRKMRIQMKIVMKTMMTAKQRWMGKQTTRGNAVEKLLAEVEARVLASTLLSLKAAAGVRGAAFL